MTTTQAFKELREAWFNRVLKSYAQEREWETEERVQLREENNKRFKQQYDEQTNAIILGCDRCIIAPTCQYDLHK